MLSETSVLFPVLLKVSDETVALASTLIAAL